MYGFGNYKDGFISLTQWYNYVFFAVSVETNIDWNIYIYQFNQSPTYCAKKSTENQLHTLHKSNQNYSSNHQHKSQLIEINFTFT